MATLYRHPVKFYCPVCHKQFSTLLGYSEHLQGAKMAGSHFGRQCDYAVYPYLCAASGCERAGRKCGIMEESFKKQEVG